MKATRKTRVASVRLTPEEMDALLRETERWGHTVSSFLRWLLKREFERLANQAGANDERPSA